MSQSSGAYFTRNFETTFGQYRPSDEDVHVESAKSQPGYALTETQYFSFSIPEKSIQAYLYLWYHPNLGVVSGGPVIFQGVKEIALAAELFDYQNYLPAEQLGGSLTNYRLGNSFSVELVEAPATYRVRYDDPSRGNSFDVVLTPVSDARMWPGDHHFDHITRARGSLTLRGDSHEVDGMGFRNRSWGEQRTEEPVAFPPFSRLTGAIPGRLSFNIAGFDDPTRDPVWKDSFSLPSDKVLKFGWVEADGSLAPVKTARMLTAFDRSNLLPQKFELEVTDLLDRTFQLEGEVNAAVPINTWPNIRTVGGQMRWRCDGITGWGEFINAQGGDFIFKFARASN